MTAALKEKKSCLFIERKIDDHGQDTCEFRYAYSPRRAGNSQAWESITNMASACRITLSQARKTLRLLNLAEITQ